VPFIEEMKKIAETIFKRVFLKKKMYKLNEKIKIDVESQQTVAEDR